MLPARANARLAAWWLVLATLALLPFEERLPQFPVGRFTVTSLEIVWMLAIASWLSSLAASRRRPNVSMSILATLGVLLALNVASALVAPGHNEEALVFVGRSAAGWLLFLAVADLVRDVADVRHALIAIVASTAIASLVGLILLALPALTDVVGVKQFTAAGAARLAGTFDYPNTAAMAFEATALLAMGLVAIETRRRLAWLWLGLGAVIVAGLTLTLSRGAALGAAVGLLVIAALGAVSHRRRAAWGLAAGAGALVALTLVVEVSVAPIARLFTDAERGLYSATYQAPAEAALNAGVASATVTVTNTGTLAWNEAGSDEFRLGFHWLSPESGDVVADGKQTFPLGEIGPGQSASAAATVAAPDSVQGYLLAWDVTRGGSLWFSSRGVPVAVTTIVVGQPQTSGEAEQVTLGDAPLAPSRTELWSVAVQMVGERPLLGVGPGTYRLRYGTYMGLQQWDERIHSNNMYLELASTTGLIGLATWVVLVVLALAGAFRTLARRAGTGEDPALPMRMWLALASIAAAAVAYIGHGFVDYFLGFNPTNGLWWAILGLVVAAPAALSARRAERASPIASSDA